ncbi:putative KH domain-containing protein [Nannochloris sp. 'desiccata']|nr:hypothetical protein KSW81_004174 [Chlorella desiccata (nom. nud.)]KAH7624244.1 putative KH domain-containing protein [Chlorella desiccata (nom. nud.)]
MDEGHTPPSTSDGLEAKSDQCRDLMETRTTSTATLHRLDMSPAPSSTPTARRSDGSSRSEELRLRVLCPVPLVGAMIGRRGDNIKRLRREANAEVVIEDFVVGSEERVLSVILHRDAPHHASTSGGDALVSVFEAFCELSRDCLTANNSSEEVDTHTNGSDGDAQMTITCIHDDEDAEIRLLVDSTQTGFIVGKSGAAIKALMEETGAHVRVMPKADLPTCAWVSDELIKLTGPHHAIVAALRILAKQLEQHPPRIHHHQSNRPPLLLAHASTGDAQFMTPPSPALLGGYHHQHPHAISSGCMLQPSGLVETVFRLLAPAARAGNIIGRNGDHVRKIRAETGARIKVYGAEDEAEERLVCVYSTEDALSQYCAAQDALVRCAISLTADDTSNGQHRMRLVAPQTSIGAVMGKKGQTMMQLRQEAGAAIRVQPMEAPLAASAATAHGGGEPGGDEIIQIDGTLQQCVSALRGVATLLRGWQIRRYVSNSPRPMTAVALSPALLAQPIGLSSVHGSLVAFPVSAHHHHSNGGTHTGSSSPAAFAALSSAMHSLGVGSAGPVLWRYRLSNAQAGAVIGKGGHHVTQIRSMTGARIHLPGDQVPDGTRVLEISGAIESCQAAHAMVNQFLALGQCLPTVPEHQSGASVLSFATPSSSSMGSPAAMASPRSLHQYQAVAAGTADMSTYSP